MLSLGFKLSFYLLTVRSCGHTFVLGQMVEEAGTGLLGSSSRPALWCPSPVWSSGALCWRKRRRRKFFAFTTAMA